MVDKSTYGCGHGVNLSDMCPICLILGDHKPKKRFGVRKITDSNIERGYN